MISPPTRTDRPGPSHSAALFLWVSAACVVAAVIAVRAILLPFVLGALLAYVLHPVVTFVSGLPVGRRAVPRWVAVVVIYVLLLTGLGVGIARVVPRLAIEIREFVNVGVPTVRERIEGSWIPAVQRYTGRALGVLGEHAAGPSDEKPLDPALRVDPIPGGGYRVILPPEGMVVERINDDHYRVVPAQAHLREERTVLVRQLQVLGQGHAGDLLRIGGGIVGGVIGGIFGFFMTLMVSAYLLVTKAQILGFARRLVAPDARTDFDSLIDRLDQGLSGVVRGQLIICMVNGAFSAIGFGLAGLKYWPVLALVAATLSIIPIFGSILSAVPAVAIGLTQGFGTGVFVLLWILGIHQVEANLLNPKIMGDAAKIHPVLVVFSLLAGEHFFGILGALLAVPVMSIAQSVFLHWRRYALPYAERTDTVLTQSAVASVNPPSSGS